MPDASNAILYFEADQTQSAITELTDQGDQKDYRNASDHLWSGKAGKLPTITPNGVYDGGAIIPAVSGSNDVVDIAECRAYIAGVLTTISASTDEAIARPTVSDYVKYSIQITSGGAFSAVKGTEGSSFSDTRGAAGGPPYVLATSIELGQVWYDSQSAAVVATDEIKQVEGSSHERYDQPGWTVKYINSANGILGYAGILFDSALPTIHTGDVPKDVYAQWWAPAFAEIPKSTDWVPPAQTVTINTEERYGATIGSVSRSMGAGGFNSLMRDNISDSILRNLNQNIWFKFFPNRLNTNIYELAQGYLGATKNNPPGANINTDFVIAAEEVSTGIYA